jgi:hypothetical protein
MVAHKFRTKAYNRHVSAKTLISVAEFDRLIEPGEVRYELDEGDLIEMPRRRYEPHNAHRKALRPSVAGLLGDKSGR